MNSKIPQGVILPVIPETVVVHLGPADQSAPNVSVGFIDYIANVASNEIYPTWPENAIIANIIAQISFALNRIYTDYYRSRGYDFDITSSTATDQAFNPAGSVFENVRQLVEDNFDGYIKREGNVEPLYALYCDGVKTTCNGLSQVGSVALAEEGKTPMEILRYYYGNDIVYVSDVPIESYNGLAPDELLKLGSVGNFVKLLQVRLNRISSNYPAIPKIPLPDGVFGVETEDAVKVFQKIFGLSVTGTVDKATWYKVNRIFIGVKKLNELLSEGLQYEDVTLQYPEELSLGDTGIYVSIIQYYLNFVSAFTTDFSDIPINGIYDEATRNHVIDFQNYAGLQPTGVMDEQTWNALFDSYYGIVKDLPETAFEGLAKPFPGVTLRYENTGDDVKTLQEYINVLSEVYPEIPAVTVDGIFGEETRDAVYALEQLFGLTVDGRVDALTWAVIADEYNTVVAGNILAEGQYPGYEITLEEEFTD